MNCDIYDYCQKNGCRYALGKTGKNMIICIGLNPSYATNKKADRTFSKIIKIAETNGYDGFLILNLYPCINSKPQNVTIENQLLKKNLEKIKYYLEKYPDAKVWCAWGANAKKKKFRICLDSTLKLINNRNCVCTSYTKCGQPHHPLYLSNDSKLNPM